MDSTARGKMGRRARWSREPEPEGRFALAACVRACESREP